MALAPLFSAEFFCTSPQDRKQMESNLFDYLSGISNVNIPPKFMARTIYEQLPDLEWRKNDSGLDASFLTVDELSCYGCVSIFSPDALRPMQQDWKCAEQLGLDLLQKGLCHAIYLRQGCQSKGFFGSRLLSAIVATPDFAKLALLCHLDMLDQSKLPLVVKKLNLETAQKRYCENTWKHLLAECKSDTRFESVIASKD